MKVIEYDEAQPLVSVIIVTHNRLKTLKLAIESVIRSSYNNLEIIVVDDASSDGTYEYLSHHFVNHHSNVKLIRFSEEVLPTAAREAGFRLLKGEYILFLDDDAILMRDTIENLMTCIQSDDLIGIAGPVVYDYTGRIQECGERILPFFRWVKPCKKDLKRLFIEVEALPSTCFMVRRKVLEGIGGWNYKIVPWHGEDADLCLRTRKVGYRVVCCPKAKVIHLSGEYIKVPNTKRAYYSARSRIAFYRYHYPKLFPLYFTTINIGIILFYITYFILRGRVAYATEYIKGVADAVRQIIR
jgi:GT2 family glycosyltransferase